MYKLVALFSFVLVIGGVSRLQAQAPALKGTAWKFYVEALHDTLTMHVGGDTSFTTSSSGELIVRSVSSLRNDTLRLRDVAGEYFCPDGEGVYRVKQEGDYLNFFLVSDPCNGRSEALNGNKFRKAN
jgi:hypothetical protein